MNITTSPHTLACTIVMRAIIALALLCVTSRTGAAAPQGSPAPGAKTSRWQLEVAAGGGFAGLGEVQVQVEPTLRCSPDTPPQCSLDPETVTLVRNKIYTWQPALATGLIFRRRFHEDAESIGVGIGGHFVFVPRGEGSSRAAPAITVHIGKAAMQLFGGLVFVPTDEAFLPNGGDRVIVPASFAGSSLVRTDSGKSPSFFAGVVIGGVPILKP
jgi:hypothetical protein